MSQQLSIDATFPGGNIIVEKIVGDEVYLRQDLRDTKGYWFYWAFKLSGAAGRQLTFHFTDGDVLGERGAAVSWDDGGSWEWLGEETVTREEKTSSFTYHLAGHPNTFPERSRRDTLIKNDTSTPLSDRSSGIPSKVLLAFCPLYTQRNLDEFLMKQANSLIHKSILCQSKAGRDVELLRLGNPDAKTRIAFTCRHHACEATASYCLEGMLEAITADDELGNWLCNNVDFAIVPFMDKDGVENGDQGKNRQPYDHNRDYGGTPEDSIYPEVKAFRQWAADWLGNAQTPILLDLHCPYIRGGNNEEVFFVGGPNKDIWQRVESLSAILEKEQVGEIHHHPTNNMPFGIGWNSQETLAGGCSCSKWAAQLPNMHLAATLEFAYANAGGAVVLPSSAREFGKDLMRAIYLYLANEV